MKNVINRLIAGAFVFLFITSTTTSNGQVQLKGVNLAGAEFGEGNLPGIYNQHYTYPTTAEVNYFTGKGMNVFRLPFRWERLQQVVYGNLNSQELSRIKTFVNKALSENASVVLDPHNYARFYGKVTGSEELPDSAFGDFWKKVALEFMDNPDVIFGLMNEPHDMTTESWLKSANTAIAAIRSTGAENLILVPGNGWTGAHSWNSGWYGTPNSQVMLNIVDPLDNYAYEVHQYLDNNSSGSSETCVSINTGVDRLKSFTSWLRTHNKRGFLGEFGASSNEICMEGIDKMLAYMDANADVWLGWTWWAAGPWWGNYMFSVEPDGGQDKPQMAVLEKYTAAETTVISDMKNDPEAFSLTQNSPNPFAEYTEITFYLPRSSSVRLNVYDFSGRRIVSLAEGFFTAGHHKVYWDGCSEKGEKLPSGVYFYAGTTGEGGEKLQGKMLIAR